MKKTTNTTTVLTLCSVFYYWHELMEIFDGKWGYPVRSTKATYTHTHTLPYALHPTHSCVWIYFKRIRTEKSIGFYNNSRFIKFGILRWVTILGVFKEKKIYQTLKISFFVKCVHFESKKAFISYIEPKSVII